MSAVCGVNANDEEHEDWHGIARVRDELQDVTATGNERHSMLSTRAKISSLCQRGVRKDQNIVKKVALETAKTATVSLNEVVLKKPERVRPEEVCEVSSTSERKTRHQLKVQNWRGERSMR